MYKKKFISTSEAAKIAGVTSQTIRNLCKAGTLTYQKRRKLFYPSREDVEKHAATIRDVQAIETDIEQYKKTIESESYRLKSELQDMQAKYRERMYHLEMFPKRVEVIKDTLLAVIDGVRRYADYADSNITSRDINIVWDALQGKSFEEIGEGLRPSLTCESARQAWRKTLRRFVFVKGAFFHLNSENDELKEILKEKNDEIARLHAQLEGRQAVIDDETHKMSKLLATSVWDCDLSMRTLNTLRNADVETLRDLVHLHRGDLLKFRNFGKKSLTELDEFLEHYGLSWNMNVGEIPDYVE